MVGRHGGQPFQLLEITVISAQDLAPVGNNKSMETYAVAWVNPDRRLTTSVDRDGHTNPSWNDKFIFRVHDAFLSAATSAVNIEIYAVSWLRDVRLGVARFLVSSLVPTYTGIGSQIQNQEQGSPPESGSSNMCFVALQVRRPSGRPQGILNVGAVILDSPMRSMPLYTELSASAVGYRQLIKDIGLRKLKRRNRQHNKDRNKKDDDDDNNNRTVQLHRTQSERSTTTNTINMVTSSPLADHPPHNNNDGSVRDSDVCPSPLVARPGAGGSKPMEYRRRKGMQENNNSNEGNEDSRRFQRRHFRRRTDGGGLFSCFANGNGFELSIKCGGNRASRSKVNGSGKVLLRPESLLDSISGSHV